MLNNMLLDIILCLTIVYVGLVVLIYLMSMRFGLINSHDNEAYLRLTYHFVVSDIKYWVKDKSS